MNKYTILDTARLISREIKIDNPFLDKVRRDYAIAILKGVKPYFVRFDLYLPVIAQLTGEYLGLERVLTAEDHRLARIHPKCCGVTVDFLKQIHASALTILE